jgi:hypothetical protein
VGTTSPSREVLERLRPRALHRAEEGRSLSRDEAAGLLTCRGGHPPPLSFVSPTS